MKPVVQLELTGCGIASVAALAGRELCTGEARGESTRDLCRRSRCYGPGQARPQAAQGVWNQAGKN